MLNTGIAALSEVSALSLNLQLIQAELFFQAPQRAAAAESADLRWWSRFVACIRRGKQEPAKVWKTTREILFGFRIGMIIISNSSINYI